ncbi:MAG: FtsQ-type POTRA domain-containing protein [Actinomycetota bacterium]
MKVLGIAVVLALGGVLAQGLLALAQSPALKLEEYEVVGNHRIGEQELVDTVAVERGEHLLAVSTSEAVERVLANPWIRKARVERILPSKLRVAVVERTARVVVLTPAGPYLVDSQGLVLQQGDENLVALTDLPVQQLTAGERIDHPAFEHAWRAYESLPSSLRVNVGSISALTVDQVKFNLNGGPEIFYGAAEEMEQKNNAIQAMLERLAGSDASGTVVDVRVPSRPALRSS